MLRADPPEVVRLQFGTSSTTDRRQFGLATAATVLMYLVLIFYGQAVAGGVNEEKSSRVVELLLSSMSSRQLLTGKVVGIGLVGLLQVILVALAAGADGARRRRRPARRVRPATVAGYVRVVRPRVRPVLHALRGGRCAHLASRGGAAGGDAGDHPAGSRLRRGVRRSQLAGRRPGHRAVVHPVQRSAGDAGPGRRRVGAVGRIVLLSMLLTVVAIVVANRLGGRVYEGAVLRFGPRIKVRQALRHDEPVGRPDATAAPTN